LEDDVNDSWDDDEVVPETHLSQTGDAGEEYEKLRLNKVAWSLSHA